MKVLHVGKFRVAHLDRQWQYGVIPSHHLHAVSELRRFGHELSFFDADIARQGSRLGFQVELLKALRRCDAVLAHNLAEVDAVAALRALGLVQVPIVAFVHSVAARSAQQLCARGADLLLPLNREATRRLLAARVPVKKILPFDFGADLAFYAPARSLGRTVLSVGDGGRDFGTLLEAARQIEAEVVIVGRVPEALRRRASPNVRILGEGSGELPFKKLQALYEAAAVVAVIHHGSDHPHGLGALVEAMAMARPVVLTQGGGIDIDPAAHGFGTHVPPHDAAELARALSAFVGDPAKARSDGAAAHDSAVQHFNSRRMAGDLDRALCTVA